MGEISKFEAEWDRNKFMNNYACKKCGMVNWATDELCRKCGTPNPAIKQSSGRNYSAQTRFDSEYGAPRGGGDGTSYRAYGNYQTADSSEMESAEKDIRSSWKAGRVWCILVGILFIIIFAVALGASSSSARGAAPVVFVLTIVMLPILAIGIGLTYGLYKKSRACAVILFTLTALGLVSSLTDLLTDQGRGGARVLFGLLFLYYFWRGVRGTFKYHKLAGN